MMKSKVVFCKFTLDECERGRGVERTENDQYQIANVIILDYLGDVLSVLADHVLDITQGIDHGDSPKS